MVNLARMQFALTAGLHFLFVALTLGLVTLMVILQTRALLARDPQRKAQLYRMTRFWGQLYVINYAVGIATGLVMEFQFGLNWSGLSRVTGDVFGAPLAMETLIAFFLESTLLGMWIFGWGRINRVVHTLLLWGVAITAYLSAFWVMVANSFLQNPVGYTQDAGGRYRLTDFGALLGNPNLGFALAHTVTASLVIGGLVMAGISCWHLFRRTTEFDFFVRSLRLGLLTATIASTLVIGFGFAQFSYLDNQPTKLQGATTTATAQEFARRFGGAPGDYLPPGGVQVSYGFMILVGFGLWSVLIGLSALLAGNLIVKARPLLAAVIALVPLPFLAVLLGWIVREMGRQPWAVYGLLRTKDAVSNQSSGVLTASLIAATALLGGLAILDWFLLTRAARRGPGDEFLPAAEVKA